MSGTNLNNGLAVRTTYSGTTSAADTSRLANLTKGISRQAVIRCTSVGTGEVQTEFTFPASAIVNDVYINVLTLDDGETVDVGTMGTSNDPDGFLDAALLTDLGIVFGALLDGSQTRGVLLSEVTEATTAKARNRYSVGADPVSFTASAAGAVFDIIIDYDEIVNEG